MNAQRQEFLTRCLNAAANLYGIVSYGEFTKLYNRYSADQDPPVSDLLRPEEIDELMELSDPDEGRDEVDDEGVRSQLAKFATPDLKILSEDEFLFYDEPKAFEETGVTKKFTKFLRQEYGYDKDGAEYAVADVKGSTYC